LVTVPLIYSAGGSSTSIPVTLLKGRITLRYGRSLFEMSSGDTLIIDGIVPMVLRTLKAPAQSLAISVERFRGDH
jgi:hypothetical protein